MGSGVRGVQTGRRVVGRLLGVGPGAGRSLGRWSPGGVPGAGGGYLPPKVRMDFSQARLASREGHRHVAAAAS